MAKKGGKKKAGKRGGKKRRSAKAASARASRKATGLKRARLHAAAAMLADFHGGKNPVKSGCGRPRGS